MYSTVLNIDDDNTNTTNNNNVFLWLSGRALR